MKALLLFLIFFISLKGMGQSGLEKSSKEIRAMVKKGEVLDSFQQKAITVYQISSRDSIKDGYVKAYFIYRDTCFLISLFPVNQYSDFRFSQYIRQHSVLDGIYSDTNTRRMVLDGMVVFVVREKSETDGTYYYLIYSALQHI